MASRDVGLFSHDLLIGQLAGCGITESSGIVAAYDLANLDNQRRECQSR
ncbi:MAG: hypothetical protein QOJ42_149 [Acidobacteriaceae bacterium]|jgi:hypothetical protein|nr:hypothetical protein [Acidobacteriaceae bacterium]